jgi:ribosomal protein S18 acetylase RimI-like enzyme
MAYEIRPYKASDKPDILEIARRTWGGHDHLPHVIDAWTADPNSHIYVIDHKNRVVSVANLKVIEGGRTGWMEGLRVHPRFRKRGLGAQMTRHLVKVGSEMGVERLRLTAATVNTPSVKLAQGIGMSEVLRLSVLWKGVAEAADWKHETLQIRKADADHAFESVQETPDLLPKNVVVHHWYAFDATPESFREMGKVVDFWVGRRDRRAVSLSLGLAVGEGDEGEWCCTIYATDLQGFLSNLSYHLRMATKRGLPALMCIHQVEFEAAYKQVAWLKRGGHRMRLGLFEEQLASRHGRMGLR